VTWTLATVVGKLAVLWLYTRIFSTAVFRRVSRVLMAFCACYGISFLVVFLTYCTPVSQPWNPVLGGTCRDSTSHEPELVSNSINTVLDIVIVCLPLPWLWSLRMPMRKKMAVMFMFSLGFVYVKLAPIIPTLLVYNMLTLGFAAPPA